MLKTFFPFVRWLEAYSAENLRHDIIAGLTVALVLIPQSMAYAQLAGLPPYYGLYASFLPPMMAALFGSSRQLATGPVAVVSLITSASLGPLATTGSQGYIAYAILLCFMVGCLQFLLGAFRLGVIVNFLSHPVVNGFTNAAALIIASSQVSKLFGVNVDEASRQYETVARVLVEASRYTHWPTFAMGVSAFAMMYGLKKISPKIPNVLVAVVVTTVISWGTGFEYDKTVDISSIESLRGKELIAQFNKAMKSIDSIAEERTHVTKAMEEASDDHDVVQLINAEHAATVLIYNIEREKSEAQECRRRLRGLLFQGIEQPDGSVKFYLKEELPAGAKTDGRIWRIKVGENTLKTDRLQMKGGGEVIGSIPQGLPTFSVPNIDFKVVRHLLPFAAIISLLGFMEAISIAKAMAGKTGQRLDPNQELIGQGLANIFGSVSKSYPTSGSFSRSAVNLQSGAVTGLSSVFTSLSVIIVLLFFTPLLYHLPQSVLAAVIMMAVIGLINFTGFIHAWEAQWYDGLISIIAFIATLGFAPHLDTGIMIGVSLSLLVFLYKSMRPRIVTLARYDDQSLKDCTTFGLKECEYIALIRFDGPLFFASSSYLEDKITERMRSKRNMKHIILVSNGINDIDASGEETLSLLIDRVRSAEIDISLSGINEKVMDVLKRTHLREKIGEDHIFPTMEKAISALYAKTHRGGAEEICPLMTVCRLA
jgi:SulP family sulfate permease